MAGLRLGTPGSDVALAQTGWVSSRLQESWGDRAEVRSYGIAEDDDRIAPLPEAAGRGAMCNEMDSALLRGEIDVAVYSFEDLPTELPPGLVVAGVPAREDSRDVVIGPRDRPTSLTKLPSRARVGTDSARRQALACAFRHDLRPKAIRGDLETRLRKVDEGEYDAIIVAAAGIRRLGLQDRVGEWLHRTSWLPAPGQGALALVARIDDDQTRTAVAAVPTLNDSATRGAVCAERMVLAVLGGGCELPLGALALPFPGGMRLRALLASPDGKRVVLTSRTSNGESAEVLGRSVADELLARGASTILEELRAAPPQAKEPAK